MLNKIKGALYGMAIGDAMGMPSELWNKNKVKNYFKNGISTFLDGPLENEVAKNYTKGQFTDDTAQALVILDSLIENNFQPSSKIIGDNLLKWALNNKAFENNILGPTSKQALNLIKNNKDNKFITKKALSNGASMRIAPIGVLFSPNEEMQLVKFVYEISKITHSSDIAISGASIIAMAVCCSLNNFKFIETLKKLYLVDKIALKIGSETFSPSLSKRIELAIKIADQYKYNDNEFINELYDVIGAGVSTIESVPSAIAIAYYSQNVKKAALLSANMGGDTDTIGAMACAICGAIEGYDKLDKNWVKIIDENNNINLNKYANLIYEYLLDKGKK
ncbi:ADP-ribosylglycohydrolase [Spiroplasma litorale]|uniref:ADP-ribosylglycohydrolase n=1 Tax=Spiroplasma litorale TaxID=216942 RepID=A0A0K1W217_9MOLU|nr:ADP-ribosylglycohydrolase family protein [Spiroplasma litorale]AKX34226.1 ADP-ribosylglycohydrolase [Spiroplasma litorale]